MSELKPGAGYENLPSIPKRFIDYVNDHARQGECSNKEVGPSSAGYIYDVNDNRQIIPFTQILFEDNRLGGLFSSPIQKDAITLYLGKVPAIFVIYELGYGSDDGFGIYIGGSRILKDMEDATIGAILDGVEGLEQSGKMIPSAHQSRPEAT